jgi:isopenicillin N synthase-like dioxygenase
MTDDRVPVLDISPFAASDAATRRAVAAQFAGAFEKTGFATIVGHGIDKALVRRTYDVALEFFDQPQSVKEACMMPVRDKTHGYIPLGVESVSGTLGDVTPPDLCEAMVVSGLRFERTPPTNEVDRKLFHANLWPDRPAALRPAFTEYYWAMEGLTQVLMRISALALDLPEDWFADKYDRFPGTLRAVQYPNQPDVPEDGQLRYGAHRDYGGLTILRQDDAPGALEVCLPSGEWIRVRPVPGALVINVGDLLARWTNDRWLSTLHRVVNPPRELAGTARRLSLVFFTGPNRDAVVECLPTCQSAGNPPKYPPVRAIDHVLGKIHAAMLDDDRVAAARA